MQHCIDLSDLSLSKYLKFAVAPVHTASLPYQFSLIEGGEFPAYQRYGYIERSKFCQLAIVGEEEEENGGGRNDERNGEEDRDSGDEGKGQREGQGAGGQEGEAGGVGRSDREEREGNGLKEPVDCTEDSELSTSQSKPIVSTHSSHSTGIPEAIVCLELVFGPQDGPITGWTVSPDIVPCQIEEGDLDHFGHKSNTPPSCLVSIYADSSRPDTVHVLNPTISNASTSKTRRGTEEGSRYRLDIAHRVMTECTSSIKDCGIDINFLVDKLLEHRIVNSREKRKITARETDDDKMDELLHIILSSICMNGKVFGIFIDILREEDTLRTIALADTLMDNYKK
uniref:CARD domain-containing protein n=1 Tax=Amphimedon queenslandica TaxID=400682 RepID=A0A1X7USF9_AMPQE